MNQMRAALARVDGLADLATMDAHTYREWLVYNGKKVAIPIRDTRVNLGVSREFEKITVLDQAFVVVRGIES